MSSFSTHVLDTAHGRPATGLAVTLASADGTVVFQGETDTDGRCPRQSSLPPGRYRVRFAVADYFVASGVDLPDPPFLDVVTVDFGIAGDGGHYHVPLLVSPFAYSTYRGS